MRYKFLVAFCHPEQGLLYVADIKTDESKPRHKTLLLTRYPARVQTEYRFVTQTEAQRLIDRIKKKSNKELKIMPVPELFFGVYSSEPRPGRKPMQSRSLYRSRSRQ